jgi:predicted DNA-binding transcriptional regulator AlpA
VQMRLRDLDRNNNSANPVPSNPQSAPIGTDTAVTDRAVRRPVLEPLLVEMRTVAQLLSISVATGWRWDSSGQLGPRGYKRGGKKLWQLSELREWVAAGMPHRREWEAMQTAHERGRH